MNHTVALVIVAALATVAVYGMFIAPARRAVRRADPWGRATTGRPAPEVWSKARTVRRKRGQK